MTEPLAETADGIIRVCEAVIDGVIQPDEADLVETLHYADPETSPHVLEALGTVRRRAGR
jgi:hypothetical protein